MATVICVLAILLFGPFVIELLLDAVYLWCFDGKAPDNRLSPTCEIGHRARKGRNEACLRCGFNIKGLKLAQCPRCDAMIGFKKSMSDMGFRPDEIEKIKSKHAETDAKTVPAPRNVEDR
ncbi:MAG: hypothetical protein H6819_07165 [Phycisphaerales bacterium]|nr:hypothetical protein [Phycisphaerales bacterium]MCB9857726.1 hypothetical protein [Phycisphaerales bacterium]MCB9863786.1 hypothetical protein [Phycisphaerales bacterium]